MLAHLGISRITGSEIWEIDVKEGETLAAAVQKVARHYNIPDVASETKDWIALMIVMSTIYGPRFVARHAEKRTPPPPPSAGEQDNVVNLLGTHG